MPDENNNVSLHDACKEGKTTLTGSFSVLKTETVQHSVALHRLAAWQTFNGDVVWQTHNPKMKIYNSDVDTALQTVAFSRATSAVSLFLRLGGL